MRVQSFCVAFVPFDKAIIKNKKIYEMALNYDIFQISFNQSIDRFVYLNCSVLPYKSVNIAC